MEVVISALLFSEQSSIYFYHYIFFVLYPDVKTMSMEGGGVERSKLSTQHKYGLVG